MATLGIPEVPLHLDQQTRDLLNALRNQVIKLRSSQAPVPAPRNFRVTPEPFGALIQFTRVPEADYYEILWSATPNLNGATIVDIGDSAEWTDHVGQVGIARWYAVRARLNSGARSLNSPTIKSVTLASNAGVNPPTPPPPSRIMVIDTITGHAVPYRLVSSAAIRRNL